jgi:hypothetical protein
MSALLRIADLKSDITGDPKKANYGHACWSIVDALDAIRMVEKPFL